MTDAMKKYFVHRANAKFRGVDWEITFEEWWGIWQLSGRWAQRGCRKGQYVMARRGDEGPYRADNVFICPATQNARDGVIHRNMRRRIPA